MKSVLMYAAAIIVVLLSVIAYTHRASVSPTVAASSSQRIIHLKENAVRVSVASTPFEREQGLSGRAGLASDEGMLFVFERDGDYAFWMKDMLFSIDMIWIDASGKIIYIAPSVSPDTYPQAFDPKMDALYVLELPAGYMQSHDIQIGNTVEF